MSKTHIMSDETGQRIAGALESMAVTSSLVYDETSGEYTNDSIAAMLSARSNGLIYGVSIPKGSTTSCTKTASNAGIANPVPGVVGRPSIDPYVNLGAFFFLEVNGYVSSDGVPHVTAMSGDGRFRRDGSNGDVWILAPVLWWLYKDATGNVAISVSDKRQSGMLSQPGAYLPDSSLRPYMLYAKYALSIIDGTARSVSGAKIANRNVSHNSLITLCKMGATGYSGKTASDDWYIKVMFLLKYAIKNSQSVFVGCTSYDISASPSVAETDTTRVIIPTATANGIMVGSSMMLGTNDPATADRGASKACDVFDALRIVRKETYDAMNTALYFDTATPFSVAETYKLFTSPWNTGSCDLVEGDGSPTSPTSGKEPFIVQGVELSLGMLEVLGNVLLKNDGATGWKVFVNHDSKNESTSVTANYQGTDVVFPTDDTDGWKYTTYPIEAGGLLIGTGTGASTTTGLCDGSYSNKLSAIGEREWLSLGALWGGAVAGLWCVVGGDGASGARWDFGSRLSVIGRSRG
ncbi:MAG: hypothetical protein RSB04_10305 [Gordonibacter sp.]|uniref:hypothetical protein n=1 Tax=Gordonibacter sp. TaxID=1968902 RepID=UPI002FCC2C6E